jgi:hypothetical protein
MIKYGCIKNMYFNKIYFHMKIYISIPWKHRSRVNCYKKILHKCVLFHCTKSTKRLMKLWCKNGGDVLHKFTKFWVSIFMMRWQSWHCKTIKI